MNPIARLNDSPRTACAAIMAAGAVLTASLASAAPSTLRLMPLGDSITAGYKSSDNNGYRGALYDLLVAQGHHTDFVGSVRGGSAFDPDGEGHSGARIDQVASQLDGYLATYQPNIVTLHIGSNDLNGGYEVSTAPDRLASMIDQILNDVPGVTVVVSQLILNSNATTQSRITAYNSQIPTIVQTRADAGKHVYMINMSTLTLGDLQDGLHPNDGGYRKMADAWNAGIQQVISKGWVSNIPFAGVYEIQSASSGQALDVSGASTANGAAVVQWPYAGGRNQLWNFIPTSAGYYQIKSANSALDLAVTNASSTNGALITQWQFGSAKNDEWLPSANADGTYTFYNRRSGRVLDIPDKSTTAGEQITQWQANGGSNQKFSCILK